MNKEKRFVMMLQDFGLGFSDRKDNLHLDAGSIVEVSKGEIYTDAYCGIVDGYPMFKIHFHEAIEILDIVQDHYIYRNSNSKEEFRLQLAGVDYHIVSDVSGIINRIVVTTGKPVSFGIDDIRQKSVNKVLAQLSPRHEIICQLLDAAEVR